jgi:hypothetical protein
VFFAAAKEPLTWPCLRQPKSLFAQHSTVLRHMAINAMQKEGSKVSL